MPVIDYLKPEKLYRPRGFVHVTVSTGARAIHVGGQISIDVEGEFQHVGDYRGQMNLAMANLFNAVEGAGASLADIARIGIYVVDYGPEADAAVFAGFGDAVAEREFRTPALVLLGVSALGHQHALVEVDGVAYA
ncbi:RidA family protein [Streptomyces spongiae]|uniref:RidA family protein n=1 Tax=Streptomyces spongiae TaxID=565072 RepID=A0A5N8XCX2_9ACTN|nr:RidA family protein [Streptomyces spongiae]MPY56375.1 RidA family protein [Streptomyces spongiae]